MNDYFTYIIQTLSGKYYVGHTRNLDQRFIAHSKGFGAKFTKQNKPLKIVWNQKFKTEIESINRERQVKGWSREKKEKLIKGVWT